MKKLKHFKFIYIAVLLFALYFGSFIYKELKERQITDLEMINTETSVLADSIFALSEINTIERFIYDDKKLLRYISDKILINESKKEFHNEALLLLKWLLQKYPLKEGYIKYYSEMSLSRNIATEDFVRFEFSLLALNPHPEFKYEGYYYQPYDSYKLAEMELNGKKFKNVIKGDSRKDFNFFKRKSSSSWLITVNQSKASIHVKVSKVSCQLYLGLFRENCHAKSSFDNVPIFGANLWFSE